MHGDGNRDIVLSDFEGRRVVALLGEWDVSNRDRLHEAFVALGADRDVLVDLRDAGFFDSTALAELIMLYKRLEALVGDSNMRRLLELTSLDALFGVSAQRAKYLREHLPSPTA
jgi:anti-anti-sigma regulatory factor